MPARRSTMYARMRGADGKVDPLKFGRDHPGVSVDWSFADDDGRIVSIRHSRRTWSPAALTNLEYPDFQEILGGDPGARSAMTAARQEKKQHVLATPAPAASSRLLAVVTGALSG